MAIPVKFKKDVTDYISSDANAMACISLLEIYQVYKTLKNCIDNGNRIFICGNGGSAANASHITMELTKNAFPEKDSSIICLNDNIAWITAIANDSSFDDIFVHPLQNMAEPGNILIALSTSGSSENIVRAAKWAIDNGLIVIGVTGSSIKKNRLRGLLNLQLIIPSKEASHIENGQLMVFHMIVDLLRKS